MRKKITHSLTDEGHEDEGEGCAGEGLGADVVPDHGRRDPQHQRTDPEERDALHALVSKMEKSCFQLCFSDVFSILFLDQEICAVSAMLLRLH